MPRSPSSLLFWAVIFLASGVGGSLAYIYSGVYDVSATAQHTPLIYWALSTARCQSIRAHAARESSSPDLTNADLVAAGLILFERYCLQCHGAPGIAPDAIGLGMNPPPPTLAQMAQDL